MGFFDKLKRGLAKTKNAIFGTIDNIVKSFRRVDEELFDKDDKMRLDKANLVAYAHGEYFELGKRIGKFGFSTNKKKKKRGK